MTNDERGPIESRFWMVVAPDRAGGASTFQNECLAVAERVSATAIQTIGGKGYTGFALIVVN